jgi:ABC-type uncharacterized transport system YnjBCD ATPase subunit
MEMLKKKLSNNRIAKKSILLFDESFSEVDGANLNKERIDSENQILASRIGIIVVTITTK